MFRHLLYYRFKSFINSRTILFWSLVFPIILGTLFNFAFKELNKEGKMEIMEVAIVEDGNEQFTAIFDELSNPDSDSYLMDITKTTYEKGKKLVEDSKVSAMVICSDKPKMITNANGYNQMIIKYVLQSYNRINNTIDDIADTNPQILSTMVIEDISNSNVKIKDLNSSGGNSDAVNNYFYTLLALTCMYGGFWGIKSTNDLQANLSARAIRVNVAPVNKLLLIVTDALISLMISTLTLLIVFLYLCLVLKVNFVNLPLVFLICLCGEFMSLGLGQAVGALFKVSENAKVSILNSITLICSFLAGMMVSSLPYYINRYFPLLKYLNPADLIAHSFAILNYGGNINDVYLNMAILIIMGWIFIYMSYRVLRRVSYGSI